MIYDGTLCHERDSEKQGCGECSWGEGTNAKWCLEKERKTQHKTEILTKVLQEPSWGFKRPRLREMVG